MGWRVNLNLKGWAGSGGVVLCPGGSGYACPSYVQALTPQIHFSELLEEVGEHAKGLAGGSDWRFSLPQPYHTLAGGRTCLQ